MPAETEPQVDVDELREVIAALAASPRPSASEAERRAADWIAARLRQHGCTVQVEEEQAYGGYWWPVAALSALGVGSALLALRGHRRLGFLGAAAAALGIIDEAAAGPYVARRLLLRPRSTWNVVAETGDTAATATLVVLAHHDSARSGLLFHPGIPKWLHETFPEQVEKAEESQTYWIALLAGPVLVGAGALVGTFAGRLVARAGALLSAISTAIALDIARSEVVPGANDNLSAVAVLIHLARAFSERPLNGLRVLLVSCGSEESLQEGVLGFARRHFGHLPRERTTFLVVDTVGSPHLVMAEAEGTLTVREYSPALKERLARLAAELGIVLHRGARLRSSTDACIPNRAGYPTALLVSMNEHRAASNYHWPTDTAANVDHGTVADCAALGEAFARSLAR